MRRRNLVLAFGIAAAIPFAAAGVVLAKDSSTTMLAAALSTLYVSLFPIVVTVSIALRREAVEHERLASYDTLTELPNRALFARRLQAAIADDKPVAVMVADIDLFKNLNDRYGHPKGDSALRGVGKRLTAAVRATDTVARLGGDEFGLILPGASPEVATQVARRIVAAFSEPLVLDEATIDISVSLGIACAAQHGRDDDDLLSRADEAMYAAKDRGGATFRMADRAANTSKGPGQAIGALRPVRRAASARGG